MVKNSKRYLILLFGAFAVFFTGYPHIWSIYQPYAIEATGWSQNQTSMCFYICFIFFVAGNIVGGRIQDRYNPRIAVFFGGGIFAASILLSAAALKPSPVMMYLTYGALQGLGQGMIYTTIISTAQKWFPGRTGFASGAIVTANGLFGFFMSPVSRILLEEKGIRAAFLAVGILIGISWILASLVISNPVSAKQKEEKQYIGRQYSAWEMVRTKKFYFLAGTMLFGLVPYMILSPLSQTVQIERGISVSVAVAAVMAGSVCNAAARLLLPAAADKIGRFICLKAVLVVAALAMIFLVAAPSGAATVCVVLVYACYGGIMGSFPSLSSSIFGMKHSGENYGYVMFGVAAATLAAPAITNGAAGSGLGMDAVFAAGAVSAAISFVLLLLLEKSIEREEETVPERGNRRQMFG